MRYLLILLILCLGGYWLYEHYLTTPPPSAVSEAPQQAPSNTGQFGMPDPLAFKVRAFKSNSPEIIVVYLIHGARWRQEMRRVGIPGITVSIFDGARLFSTNPKRTDTKGYGPILQKALSSLNGATPVGVEKRDGHTCLHYKDFIDPVGNRGDVWVDQQTLFPVYLSGWANGAYSEVHFQLLKSDFSILEKTCFDTSNTAPMLTPFLTP